jgi:hypothetical protein
MEKKENGEMTLYGWELTAFKESGKYYTMKRVFLPDEPLFELVEHDVVRQFCQQHKGGFICMMPVEDTQAKYSCPHLIIQG